MKKEQVTPINLSFLITLTCVLWVLDVYLIIICIEWLMATITTPEKNRTQRKTLTFTYYTTFTYYNVKVFTSACYIDSRIF